MYDHILVPVVFGDNKEEKIGASGAVAKKLAGPNTRITLLHVMEDMPGYVSTYLPANYAAQAHKALEVEVEDAASALPNATGLVVHGHSARTIIEWADGNAVDLIVIASHQPGMQDLLLGSTAAQVVRHAHCAVHVLR